MLRSFLSLFLRAKEKETNLVTIENKIKNRKIDISRDAILHEKQVFGKRRQEKENTLFSAEGNQGSAPNPVSS